jgi:glycosyltransferase involved in cell wall biosynthesis
MKEQPLTLVFAGPDEDGMRQKLASQASRLGLSASVKFPGPLFAQDKWSAYRDAHVFVLPSQNENFGNTAAEAVAAGTPVVVTRQCGIAPLLENSAGLVVEHDATSLAAALEQLLRDEQLHTRLAAGCAEVTARLGWEQPVGEMENLYSRLIVPSNALSPGDPR